MNGLRLILLTFPLLSAINANDVITGINSLATDIYQAFHEREENSVFSPFGTHSALSLLYEGASGETETALAEALYLSSKKEAADKYRNLQTDFLRKSNVSIVVANKLFVRPTDSVKESFANVAVNDFDSEVANVDFSDKVNAANEIQSWIKRRTEGKIGQFVTPWHVDSATRAVLVNTVYFKGEWADNNSLNKFALISKEFHKTDGETVETVFIHSYDDFLVTSSQKLDAKILKLPYRDERYSLILMLPNEQDGIFNLEKKLVGVNISPYLKQFEKKTGVIAVPRFKITHWTSLKGNLAKLGFGEIFDKKTANFSDLIDSTERLYLDDIWQATNIEVGESGTEASTSTVERLLPVLSVLSMAYANEVISAVNLLATDMYQELMDNIGDTVFSPLALHASLSLLYEGAAGDTEDALREVLHLTSKKQTTDDYRKILRAFSDKSNVTFNIASKLYLRLSDSVKIDFQNVAVNDFRSEIGRVNFSDQTSALEEINEWIKGKTNRAFISIIPSWYGTRSTRAVVINVINFKGKWGEGAAFAQHGLVSKAFTVSPRTTITTEFVHAWGEFLISSSRALDARLLKLPYADGRFSLVIMLPNKLYGVDELGKKLAGRDASSYLNDFEKIRGVIAFPRFTLDSCWIVPLTHTFKKMGFQEIFDKTTANFSDIVDSSDPLYLDNIFVRSAIALDTEGSQFYSGSASDGEAKILENTETVRFEANHPFLFFITAKVNTREYNRMDDIVLFMGKLNYPTYSTTIKEDV